MTSSIFTQLSYYRSDEASSIDVVLRLDNSEIHGFQYVADITAGSQLELQDQNLDLPDVQLSVPKIDGLNILTNKIVTTDSGYRLILAGVTSNPRELYATSDDLVVGKIIFKQPTAETVAISPDLDRSKISLAHSSTPTQDERQSNSALTDDPALLPEPELAATSHLIVPTGDSLELLDGSTFSAPAAYQRANESENNQPESEATGNPLEYNSHEVQILQAHRLSHVDINWRDFGLGAIFMLLLIISAMIVQKVVSRPEVVADNQIY